jgi:hypothetical protein
MILMSNYGFDPDQDRAEAARKLEQRATTRLPVRDTYGVPVFIGAWVGAMAQAFSGMYQDYSFLFFLAAVVLLGLLVSACNRR